ncbi:MAG TPA: alpha/beta fold hydrolase, partial [Gemmatimonadaceae bacterium]|nr:alpha/beta fold hydrolase [Gemmatimonadaceae bacterium]
GYYISMNNESTRSPRLAYRPVLGALLAGAVAIVPGCMLANPSLSSVAAPPAPLAVENVAFQSLSGSLIHAWLMRGREGGGSVLLLHGVGENRSSMLGRARFLHDEGFTVLAPDFQAHGESPGDHVTFGARESLDAAAAMTYLHAVAPAEPVGVIGVSMGGAASLLGPGPLSANAFVLESVYPTIRQAVSDRLATWFGPFSGVGRWFTPAVINIVGNEIGVAESELQPISRIGSIHAPLLLIAGTEDPYTPLAEAESLYARAPSPKSFWAVNGAGHEDLHAFGRLEYERRVGGFLMRHLQLHSAAAVGDGNGAPQILSGVTRIATPPSDRSAKP